MTLCVAEDSTFRSLKQALHAARDSPNELTYGANLGAPSHFSGLLLEHSLPGARFRFVQTGGGATRFAELKGRHIQFTTFSVSEYLRFQSGGVRALAFLGAERHDALPETPTAREQGFDVVTSNIQFWWAPKGAPADRIKVLADALEAAMKTDYVRDKLASMSVSPLILRGESLRRTLAQRELETAKVGVRKLRSLPNLPAAVIVIVILLAIATARQHFRKRSPVAASGIFGSTADAARSIPPREALYCALIIAAYVGTLQSRLLPFPLVTALFVFGLGAFLERLSSERPAETRHRRWPALATLALSIAVGSHIVFTRILTIDLP